MHIQGPNNSSLRYFNALVYQTQEFTWDSLLLVPVIVIKFETKLRHIMRTEFRQDVLYCVITHYPKSSTDFFGNLKSVNNDDSLACSTPRIA